jgi:Protein of unknown function (DUF3095)
VLATYLQQVVENSDFRKFDDGLRMILDCAPDLADMLENRLLMAQSAGKVRYGLHRQDAALMTCFTPSVTEGNHVHFIDGAGGGCDGQRTAGREASTVRSHQCPPLVRLPSNTLRESGHLGTHTWCQEGTYAVQQICCLLDHVVGNCD